jgi:hypothetical protein
MTVQELKRQIDVPLLSQRALIYYPCEFAAISGVVPLLLLIGISLVAPGNSHLETVLAWAPPSGERGAQNHF